MTKLDSLGKLIQEMKLRNLSQKTIKSYTYYASKCLEFVKKDCKAITELDVRDYLGHLAEKGVSASTLNTVYSALKLFFGVVLDRKFFVRIPRAKKSRKLPVVLSKNEVVKMIELTSFSKHRCILSLLYGSGLRVGEVVSLKIGDVDIDRKLIHIRGSKGAKDRLVPLPDSLIRLLIFCFQA